MLSHLCYRMSVKGGLRTQIFTDGPFGTIMSWFEKKKYQKKVKVPLLSSKECHNLITG